MPSISRFPYREYHSDQDNLSIISEASLNQSIELLLLTIDDLERQTLYKRQFSGVVALANPKYDLYVDTGQVAFNCLSTQDVRNLRLLMDLIPLFPDPFSLTYAAEKTQILPEIAANYLDRWVEKGLLTKL